MHELISVIVPVFNVADYLLECLDSIRSQSYKHIEVIIVDDGSTDDSGRICDDYVLTDSRFHLIHHGCNKGLACARKTGVLAATGKYILFADSDDILGRRMIERLACIAMENNADIAVCGFDRNMCDTLLDASEISRVDPHKAFRSALRGETYFVVTWNKLVNRELFLRNDAFAPEGMTHDEDVFMVYRLFWNSNVIVATDEILYHWRERPESSSRTLPWADSRRNRQFTAYYQAIKALEEFVQSIEITGDDLAAVVYRELKVLVYLARYGSRLLTKDERRLFGRVGISEIMESEFQGYVKILTASFRYGVSPVYYCMKRLQEVIRKRAIHASNQN